MKGIWKFLKDENGLEFSEYAILGGLIIVIAVATIGFWGGEINRIFGLILAALRGVAPA